MGENPVPNAVAFQLVKEFNPLVILLYSKETLGIANNIKKWIRGINKKSKIVTKYVDVASPQNILEITISLLEKMNEELEIDEIKLNYTSGNKIMSVHSYMALREWEGKTGTPVSYDYIDATTWQLIVSRYPNYILSEEQKSLKNRTILSIDDLKLLHNWNDKGTNLKINLENLKHLIEELIDVHSSNSKAKNWFKWKKKELHPYIRNNQTPSKHKLGNARIKFPRNKNLEKVVFEMKKTIWKESDIYQMRSKTYFKPKLFSRSIGYFPKHRLSLFWLDGMWLETAVYMTLLSIKEEVGLKEIQSNLEVTSNPKFEIDLIAIKDFTLFAFSCTTITDAIKGGKQRLKKKLFEIVTRSHQLGGLEARSALICFANHPSIVEHEAKLTIQNARSRVKVFGKHQIKDLAKHMESWFNESM